MPTERYPAPMGKISTMKKKDQKRGKLFSTRDIHVTEMLWGLLCTLVTVSFFSPLLKTNTKSELGLQNFT